MVPQQCIDLVKQFEGCKLSAYPDPATGGAPYTVGFGATGVSALYGPITADTVWTMEQALADLTNRLEGICERIRGFCQIDLNDNQLSALACLAYNIGAGALESSFLMKCVNANNMPAAAAQFVKWDRASRKEMPGLLRRREAEAKLFSSAP